MPSSKQRVQVLLAGDVLELVKQISDETGLSYSRVSSMLVHDGLRARGYLEEKGKPEKRPIGTMPTKEEQREGRYKLLDQSIAIEQQAQVSAEDIELLKKLKKLKALEDAGII